MKKSVVAIVFQGIEASGQHKSPLFQYPNADELACLLVNAQRVDDPRWAFVVGYNWAIERLRSAQAQARREAREIAAAEIAAQALAHKQAMLAEFERAIDRACSNSKPLRAPIQKGLSLLLDIVFEQLETHVNSGYGALCADQFGVSRDVIYQWVSRARRSVVAESTHEGLNEFLGGR